MLKGTEPSQLNLISTMKVLLLFAMIFTTTSSLSGDMTPERMVDIIRAMGEDVREHGNVVEFSYQEVPMVLVFDPKADRMRLITPILAVNELKPGQLEKAMEANFHSALDARYAISQNLVWAVFIHPLSDLSPKLMESAIRQVATASTTFGESYSSGELVFGGGE